MNLSDENFELIKTKVVNELLSPLFHKINNKVGVALANLDIMALEKQSNGKISDGVIEDSQTALKEMHALIESFVYLSKSEIGELRVVDFSRELKKIYALFGGGVIRNSMFEDKSVGNIEMEAGRVLKICYLILGFNTKLRSFLEEKKAVKISVQSEKEEIAVNFESNLPIQPLRSFVDLLNSKGESDEILAVIAALMLDLCAKTYFQEVRKDLAVLTLRLPVK